MYLIDTNIIIYYLNNEIPQKSKKIITDILINNFNISVISKMELLGFKEHTEESFSKTKQFISYANIINIDESVINKVIEIKRKYSIKLPDAIIGATTIINNYILVTRNISDFEKLEINIFNPFL